MSKTKTKQFKKDLNLPMSFKEYKKLREKLYKVVMELRATGERYSDIDFLETIAAGHNVLDEIDYIGDSLGFLDSSTNEYK